MNMSEELNISAGIVIKLNPNKILLAHPTNRPWKRNLTIPKGGVEKGERVVDAAIRETKEEVGIKINKNQLEIDEKLSEPSPAQYTIWYTNKDGKCYKRVYYFLCEIDSLGEINLEDEEIPDSMLQDDEIDWAKFLSVEEARDMIFRRFDPILKRHF